MASMRVHELAKELNMSSKELLERLAEMKIPAKSHASVLNDAYVQKIRKNLAPEEKAQAGIIDQREPLVRLLVLPPLLMSLQLIILRRGQRRLLMLISPIRSHLKKNALRVKRPKLKQKLVEPQLNAMLKRNVRLKRACGEINVRARQHLRYQWMYQARAKQQHRNLQLVRLIGSIHCCLKSKANSSVFRVKKQR